MGARFANPITIQGLESDDGRLFHEFVFRTLPLTMRWVEKDKGWGHQDAQDVGVLQSIREATDEERAEVERELQAPLPANAVVWWGEGEYLDIPAAQTAEQIAKGGAAFISVDPGGKLQYRYEIVDPDGNVVDPSDVDRASTDIYYGTDDADQLKEWLSSLRERMAFDLYEVGAMTQLGIACWHPCRVALREGAAAEPAPAAGGPSTDGAEDVTDVATQRARRLRARITASAGTKWPAAAFAQRAYTGPTHLTVNDDRSFGGHVAYWDGCHRGFSGCVKPSYETRFEDFHTSAPIELDDGTWLQMGALVDVGGHGDSIEAFTLAMEDPTCQLGPCRAYADEFGIQVQGMLHVDVTQGEIDRALLGRPSGDWRPPVNGTLHGIAMVNTEGYVGPLIEEEDGEITRMVAAMPGPSDGRPVDHDMLFFDVPPSVVKRAVASARPAPEADGGCGCGGTCGGCGHGPAADQTPLTPADLAELAALDQADHTRKSLARARRGQ
jgi:hypothetical protein